MYSSPTSQPCIFPLLQLPRIDLADLWSVDFTYYVGNQKLALSRTMVSSFSLGCDAGQAFPCPGAGGKGGGWVPGQGCFGVGVLGGGLRPRSAVPFSA